VEARERVKLTPVSDERNPDRFARFGDRQLDDLDFDPRDAPVLKEQRLADMLGDRLDQLEMDPRRQRGRRGVLRSR